MGIALIVCPSFYQIFTVSFLARKLVFSPTISRTFHCYRSSLIGVLYSSAVGQ
jgi:hypothetical protein